MKRSIALILSMLLTTAANLWAVTTGTLYSMETVVVDSFDNNAVYPETTDAIEWQVQASKAIAEGYPRTVLANTWPRDRFGEAPENAADLRALAVNASFVRRGDNYLDIVPGRQADGGWQAEPLPLSGEVIALGLWIWGSNYDYTLDASFMDMEGIEYRLPMGSLKFMGWRNLTVRIPASIKQRNGRFPAAQTLRLSKLTINLNPQEKADDFYVYIDNITTYSQVRSYEAYDGSDLASKAVAAGIWGEMPQQPAPNPSQGVFGPDNPNYQKIQEFSVDKFEDASFWQPQMMLDDGIVAVKSFEGGPEAKQPLEGDSGEDRKFVGARVKFNRRSISNFIIKPRQPLQLNNGIVKLVSVWVAGRNAPHELKLMVRDQTGNRRELSMGLLNFSGWKQMSVAIPSVVRQQDPRHGDRAGLTIEGFRVKCSLLDTYGSYYIYFDDLRALTDTYATTTGRDADDPQDDW